MIKKIFKGILAFLVGIISLVVVAWGGLNIAKFAIYSEYYSINENVCKNPGLNDGFVCQGIAANEANNVFIVSGYMKDHSASRLYITDKNNESYFVSLSSNGKAFKGHAGGVATSGDNIYLASGDTIYTFSLSEVLNSENGAIIDIGEGIEVNNQASFVYTDETHLYVGEFHDGENYITEHPYQTNDGKYYAIISRYPLNDLTTPNKIYSIRNKVQGACFTPDGKVVLSTSYGLSSSVFYVYNEADAVYSGQTLDGAPVYYLNNCLNEIKGPAMSEDLDYYDGKVITLFESACNKYIFGKFFFANKIVSLDINK
ncbi:MAG: hypothetical protein IJD46_01425 [Bacilli bacterium]|nr:hypothetical protein [Bacilli bacterium]